MDINFPPMLKEFGLAWWRIEVEYVPLDGAFAQMVTHDEYERSLLSIDPHLITDESKLKDTIEHELLHITQGPYNSVHQIIAKMLDDNQNEVIDEAFRIAKERNIRNLERLVFSVREFKSRD